MPSVLDDVPSFKQREDFLAHCAEFAPPGIVCEFGVFEGKSLRMLMKLMPNRDIYGFDSFDGLPADWHGGFHAGKFATKPPEGLPANVHIVIGRFGDSIPPWARRCGESIALAHIDCDLFDSTVTVLDHAGPLFRRGTVLVFDEFLLSGKVGDEAAAFFESGIRAKYIARMEQKRVALQVI